MSSVLNKIGAATQQRLNKEKESLSLAALKKQLIHPRKTHDFKAIFQEPGRHIIAEVKLASPSQGLIAPDLKPLEVAASYLENGAAALSILTEPEFFQGSLDYLKQIRNAFPEARLLMKDFILDPYQLYQGRLAGADACLLIVALLKQEQLQSLYQEALSLGLTPLVEVHNLQEMERASALGATLIGVNNRNLKTLEIDLETSKDLQSHAPKQALLICESQLKTYQDISLAQSWGYQGFLVGTQLMASGQPGNALAQMLEPHHAS